MRRGLVPESGGVRCAASGQWGNAGRNSITGRAVLAECSMARTFRLSDRFNADLRIDATNALNHVDLSKLEYHDFTARSSGFRCRPMRCAACKPPYE